MKRDLPYLAVLLFIALYLFGNAREIFFQQDEWLTLGHVLSLGPSYVTYGTTNILQVLFAENRLLARAITYFVYNLDNISGATMTLSIFFHFINSSLVYYITKKLSSSRIYPLLSSLFFLTSSVSLSAVIWPAAVIVTLPSTTLILLSLISYLKYLQTDSKKHILISLLLVYVSLFIKETGIFLILLYPLGLLIYEKITIKKFVKYSWPILAFLFSMVAFRLSGYKASSFPVALYLTGASEDYKLTLLARLIMYPLTSFSLLLFPINWMINLSRSFTNIYYPFISPENFVWIAQTLVLDIIAIILTTILLSVIYFMFKKSKLTDKKHAVFLLIFIATSLMPYAIVEKQLAYMDSRFYYVSTAGSALLISSLLENSKKLKPILTIAILALIFTHIRFSKTEIDNQIALSRQRSFILNQIKQIQPTLSNPKNIFLIAGDTDFYLPRNPIPFQNGFGYTLMVNYFNSGIIPKELLREDFLYELGSNGYKAVGEHGFGYFNTPQNFSEQEEDVNVVSLHYNSVNNEIIAR